MELIKKSSPLAVCAIGAFLPFVVSAADVEWTGDTVEAVLFPGTQGTAEGNPALDGQGWYRKDLSTPLNPTFQEKRENSCNARVFSLFG